MFSFFKRKPIVVGAEYRSKAHNSTIRITRVTEGLVYYKFTVVKGAPAHGQDELVMAEWFFRKYYIKGLV